MRQPSAPAWIRASIVAAALIAGLATFVSGACAEDKFPRLFVFGDSYTDIALAGLWRVYPLPLQENLGIDQMVEFGVGGARVSPFGSPSEVAPGWHPQQQVANRKRSMAGGTRRAKSLTVGQSCKIEAAEIVLEQAERKFEMRLYSSEPSAVRMVRRTSRRTAQ
jgi:hypothetical protein